MAKKKRKKEVKKIEKKLEEEIKTKTEEELRQKCKDLASIIEEMSGEVGPIDESQLQNIIEPKIKEIDEKFQTNIQELKGTIEDLSKKVEKPVKMKGDITSAINEINEKLEPRLAGLEEQMKSLDKIQDLEEKIKSLTGEPKKGGEAVPKKLSLLEEKVIQTMQDEIISVKESLQNLSNEIDVFKDRTDKKMQKFFEHLSPETVKKLEELIAFLDTAVPSKVREEVGEKFKSIFDQLKDLRSYADDLEKKLNKTSSEVEEDRDKIKSILELKHELKGSIIDLEIDKEKITKIMQESDKKYEKRDVDLELKFKSQIDTLNKRFEDFEEVLNNYVKITQDRVTKMLSEFSDNSLSKMEKKYYNTLSSTQQSIKNLESQLKKFVDFVNLSFNSVKENSEDLNLRLEKFKELEKQEHLKLDKKMALDIEKIENMVKEHSKNMENNVTELFSNLTKSKISEIDSRFKEIVNEINEKSKILDSQLLEFKDTINLSLNSFSDNIRKLSIDLNKINDKFKNTPKIIEDNVNKLFSGLTEQKLSELEKRYHNYLSEINENAKIIQSNLYKFEKLFNSTLTSFDSRIKTISSDIEKIKDNDREAHSKLNKKISLDIEKIENMVKEHSKNMENNVTELFSNLTKSKISEIDSRFEGIVNEINEKSKIIDSQLLEFKDTVNSNLTSFNDNIGKLNFQLNKIDEKQTEFAFKNDIDKINDKFKEVIQEAGNIRSIKENIEKDIHDSMSNELNQKLASVNSKILSLKEEIHSIKNMVKKELDKRLAADKIKFEETLAKIMDEKKSLEKILNEQKEKINSLLGELNTK